MSLLPCMHGAATQQGGGGGGGGSPPPSGISATVTATGLFQHGVAPHYRGVGPNENPAPGFETWANNNNEMVLQGGPPSTMDENPSLFMQQINQTHTWQRVIMLDNIQLTGNTRVWEGPFTPGFTVLFEIEEGFNLFGEFVSHLNADFGDNWTVGPPNSKGHANLQVIFRNNPTDINFGTPGVQSPAFRGKVTITENADPSHDPPIVESTAIAYTPPLTFYNATWQPY